MVEFSTLASLKGMCIKITLFSILCVVRVMMQGM
jgi:hypothetical protein